MASNGEHVVSNELYHAAGNEVYRAVSSEVDHAVSDEDDHVADSLSLEDCRTTQLYVD